MANSNKAILSIIEPRARTMILEAVAMHYGISPDEAYDEVTDVDAEHLLEYLVEPQRSATSVLIQRHGL